MCRLIKVLILSMNIFKVGFAANLDWRSTSVIIDQDHVYYSKLQETLNSVLELFPNNIRCQLFINEQSLQVSVGVNALHTLNLMKNCSENHSYNHLKLFNKKYLIITNENQQELKFTSWTDANNNTYLSQELFTDPQELKKSLFHELMISFDAKSLMYFTTYLKIENIKSVQMNSSDTQLIQHVFNISNWTPIRQTFAAMRALQLENIYINNQEFKTLSHSDCQNQFLEYFYDLYQNKYAQMSPTTINEVILQNNTIDIDQKLNSFSDEQIIELIILLFDKNLTLYTNNQKVTFCQYMSKPLISSDFYLNSFSNGPRPRLNNPSNGGGARPTSDSQFKNQINQLFSQRSKHDETKFYRFQNQRVLDFNIKYEKSNLEESDFSNSNE